MDPADDNRTDDNLAKELQTAIENDDIKSLEESMKTSESIIDSVLQCKKLRSHQARTFGYTDATVGVLHYAAYQGNLDTFKALFDNGFDIKTRTPGTKWTALHFAAFGGKTGTESGFKSMGRYFYQIKLYF